MQVGGELDAREGAAEGLGQRPHQQGLAEPRHALEEHVAAREQAP